jgi:mannose-1-phosphate guanylyltransferase
LVPLAGSDGVVVVTGEAHAADVREQLPPSAEVFAEPAPRDSMPAIGLAAAVMARRQPNATIGSFAADHLISDVPAFTASVRRAIEAAHEGFVAVIGIRPAGPSTAFGYIQEGDPLSGLEAKAVRSFTEKPDAATAESYLASGEYRWNAGMFVARARTLMDHLEEFQPALAAGLETIARSWDTADRCQVMAEIWPDLPGIAIDHAIAEPLASLGGMAVVDGDFDWDDIGDWRSIGNLTPPAADGVRHLPPPGDPTGSVVVDSPDSMIVSQNGRMVAVVGIPGAVIVDTPDALLVTTQAHTQQIKQVVEDLTARSRTDLL